MAFSNKDLKTIREYLLGQLGDHEQRLLEERLLIEDELAESLDIVEDELIHEYVAEQLNRTEYECFKQNFLATPERRQKYRLARALRRYMATSTQAAISTTTANRSWWPRPLFVSRVVLFASVMTLLVAGWIVWRGFFYQSPVERGLVALNSAYRQQRPIEARISRLDYAPFATTRGPGGNKVDETGLRRAELSLLDALNNRPTPAAHHALGKLYLARKQFDLALENLELARKDDPNNALIYADLGAALLEKGKSEIAAPSESTQAGQGLLDLARSLEYLNKSLQLDGSLVEALFNRALCHEYMGLTNQAAADWREYLNKDPTSPWAEEARQHLSKLELMNPTKSASQVRSDFIEAYQQRNEQAAWRILSQTREMITGTMIPLQLARSVIRSDKQNRDSTLSALHYAGQMELERAHDPFFSELAQYYANLSSPQEQSLGAALDATAAGYQSCLAGHFDTALDQFEQARTSFHSSQDTWETRIVEYWIAYCYTRTGKLSESTNLLTELADYCESRSYKWLLMQALSWIANNDTLQRDYSQSLAYDTRALVIANEIADTYMQQKILAQVANEYVSLAAPGRALSYIRQALSLTDLYYVSPRQQWRNYNFAADILFDLHIFAAAVEYGRESLRLAQDEFRDPTTIHDSFVRLGRLYGGLENFPEAIHLAEQGLQVSDSLPPGRASETMSAFSHLQLGDLERLSGKYQSALSHYNDAERFYEPAATTGFSVNYYESRKGRLACYVELNEDVAIESELQSVLQLFEEHRATILEEENRNTFFDKEQSVYDTAIAHAYSRHEPQLAFDYSERFRARSLLDTFHNNGKVTDSVSGVQTVFSGVAEPLNRSEISTRMPTGVQLVQYAVLPDKLLIWVVSRSDFQAIEQPISAATLNSLVNGFVQLLAAPPSSRHDETRKLALSLYEVLIKPIELLLDANKTICIVPDKSLTQLSFAALVSSETNDYLVAKYRFLYAPSSSIFILSTEVARKKGTLPFERILTVGNPTFDHQSHPDLSDLPNATREAQTIAGFYRQANQLLGSQANKSTFEREMERSEVVHFAGHYLPDEASPLRSGLLLAVNDRADNGVFTVQEIKERRFTRPRLIVLSACRSELDRYYNGEGAIGIARGFLGAGIPLVVASQWPVDSEATERLMIAFHRLRTQTGLPTTVALQQAQIDLLHNSENPRLREPYYWAAFMVLGGDAPF